MIAIISLLCLKHIAFQITKKKKTMSLQLSARPYKIKFPHYLPNLISFSSLSQLNISTFACGCVLQIHWTRPVHSLFSISLKLIPMNAHGFLLHPLQNIAQRIVSYLANHTHTVLHNDIALSISAPFTCFLFLDTLHILRNYIIFSLI